MLGCGAPHGDGRVGCAVRLELACVLGQVLRIALGDEGSREYAELSILARVLEMPEECPPGRGQAAQGGIAQQRLGFVCAAGPARQSVRAIRRRLGPGILGRGTNDGPMVRAACHRAVGRSCHLQHHREPRRHDRSPASSRSGPLLVDEGGLHGGQVPGRRSELILPSRERSCGCRRSGRRHDGRGRGPHSIRRPAGDRASRRSRTAAASTVRTPPGLRRSPRRSRWPGLLQHAVVDPVLISPPGLALVPSTSRERAGQQGGEVLLLDPPGG